MNNHPEGHNPDANDATYVTHGLNEPSFGDEAGAPPELNDAVGDSRLHQGPTINSINAATNKRSNRGLRVVVGLVVFAAVIGLGAWFAIHWVSQMKDVIHAQTHSGKAAGPSADSPNSLNPESTARASTGGVRAIGSDGGPPPAMVKEAERSAGDPIGASDIRPIKDDNGKIVLNGKGRAVGVDSKGRLVEVPAIGTMDGSEQGGKRPLPGQTNVAGGQQGAPAGGAPPKKPPSRYGGSLLADGLTAAAVAQASAASETASSKYASSEQRTTDMLRAILQPRGQDTSSASATAAMASAQDPQAKQTTGPLSGQLTSSKTAVALAARMKDQTLLLPKDRQGDCILTTRIINELPGLTSCTLTQDLYGADGKVVLLERGSEVSGEYGVGNQMGQRRLFIVWTRVRTPEGVEVDLQSPAADPLGTSGVPGYLEQRWAERIGAALVLSVMKDTIALAIARASPATSGSSVVVQPGQSTIQTGQDLAEQVLKQTINVKPTLYINEGTRVSIYVARDLDFSPVYALKTVASRAVVSSKVN
jgi:type IV secretion system protein VirB10